MIDCIKYLQMKKLLILLLMSGSLAATGQDREVESVRGEQLSRLFSGGSINLGFSGYTTNLGISPQLGYSLTPWADAGINVNFNYVSQRDYQVGGDKLRQTIIGPGAFIRLFPVNFLFASAQFEYNFINYKYIPASGSGYQPDKLHVQSPALLAGAGYAGGRERGNNTYYYFSVAWDVMGDENSPYIDSYGRKVPVIRAGYNIGLFQGKRSRY